MTISYSVAMAEAMKSEMIRKYSEMDIDELLSQLNENELEQLVGMVSFSSLKSPIEFRFLNFELDVSISRPVLQLFDIGTLTVSVN